jgi:hypothetical protein
MTNQTATELRARATQARRIAENIHNQRAHIELREMADALDAEAEKLERGGPESIPPTSA